MAEIITAASPSIALAEIRRACREGRAREIRQEAQMSLREIATDVGVDTMTLSRWERAITRPAGSAALEYLALLRALERSGGPIA